MLGLERVLSGKPPLPRVGHRAAPPPDRRSRRDAHRADRGEPEGARERNGHAEEVAGRGRRDRRRPADRSGGARRRRAGAGRGRRGPRRDPALPLPPSHGVGQDDRGGRLRRGRADGRRAHPHPPPPARRPVPPRAARARLRRPADRGDPRRPEGAPAREPDHDPDLRLVRAPRRRDRPGRLPARDLRRGPHRARREDVGGDPRRCRSRSSSA